MSTPHSIPRSWHRRFANVAVLALLLNGAIALEKAHAQATSNPPERLTYQGYVVDANGKVLGETAPKNYDVVFRIYDAQTGGNVKWAEQQTVTVDKGYFSVLLGEGTSVGQPRPDLNAVFAGADASDRFVEITVKGIGTPDATIAPRLRLLTSPYAFLARNANNLVTSSGQSLFSAGIGVLQIAAPIQSTGGNARGNGATDLQTARAANDQVASGANSVLVGGARNRAAGDYSFVGAGLENIALGTSSAIVAGFQNKTTNTDSFVGGGGLNLAEGYRSVIGGGGQNRATFDHSSVLGGFKNVASGLNASVGGGAENTANGITANIGGGFRNYSTGLESFTGGGTLNTNTAPRGFIGGGVNNKVLTEYGLVAGGLNNSSSGGASSVLGGDGNIATANHASVAGGFQNQATEESAFVGGGWQNKATGIEATVAGGLQNLASGQRGTVGGGNINVASGLDSTVAGGFDGQATKPNSAIGGGLSNRATGDHSTVAGGHGNTASGLNGTVGGGFGNTASGVNATVPGGDGNVASGVNSFVTGWHNEATGFEAVALGRRAKSRADRCFTFADGSVDADFAPATANSFSARAAGGVYFYSNGTMWLEASRTGVWLAPGSSSWAFVSDRNAKKNFEELDYKDVLAKLDKVPITAWHYKSEADGSTKNIGPVAQDFKQTFYPGRDDKSITTLELDGVELAAIKGLRDQVNEKDLEIQDLKKQMSEMKALLEKVAARANVQ